MTRHDELIDKEFILAQTMKDTCCDDSGKEVDVVKAAEYMHQIGKLYSQRSPDKISLIKSAGLFNASILRKPSNVSEIKSDLFHLCEHVLQLAEARNQNANLVRIAEEVKTSMNKLRKEVELFLQSSVPKIPMHANNENLKRLNSTKISAIQNLNKKIADVYKSNMLVISQFCENLMGKRPCSYAIVGIGSLARNEITPYSDFEHIILLNDDEDYKSYVDYFKWYTVIFNIIILNIQETIVPSLHICSLNDKNAKLGDWYYDAITPRGIAFDGMMPQACKFPLGRQEPTKNKQFITELIKPVSEMLEYLGSEADLKNGYHLADILTKTCFVFGNEDIFKQFADGARKYRSSKSRPDIINDVKQQVKDDLNNFSARFRLTNLKSQDTINIKQLVYRSTTVFIAALGRIASISANSCFDIINKMAECNKITQTTAYKLQCAIAIACEMRLRVYTEKKSQHDNVIDLKQNGTKKFLNIVGVASTINYFQIAYCLQCEVAKQLKFNKLHFYSDSQLMNVTIGFAFGINQLTVFSQNLHNCLWNLNEFQFDACINYLEARSLQCLSCDKIQESNEVLLKTKLGEFSKDEVQIKSIACYLDSTQFYDEALDFFKRLLDIYHSKNENNQYDYSIAWVIEKIGTCLNNINQQSNALQHLHQALRLRQTLVVSVHTDEKIAELHIRISQSYTKLHKFGCALNHLNIALNVYQTTSINFELDERIAYVHDEIACCLAKFHRYKSAIHQLNHALQIRQNIMIITEDNESLVATLHEIGNCYSNLCRYDKALYYLNKSLEIKRSLTVNADRDINIASTLHEIGRCHSNLGEYDVALVHFNDALAIKQQVATNVNSDQNVAVTFHEIGRCHTNMHQYQLAMQNFNKAIDIKKQITLIGENQKELSLTLHEIGRCCNKLCQYDVALNYLSQALNIEIKTSPDSKHDKNVALTLRKVSRCHINLRQFDMALNYLNQALAIEQNATLDAENDKIIAMIFHEIGRCHTNLHQKNDVALNHLKFALKIKKNITQKYDNRKNKRSIALTLHEIGRFLCNMGKYASALVYFMQALKIKNDTLISNQRDASIATTLHEIGRCYVDLGQLDTAIKFLHQALEIKQNFKFDSKSRRSIALTLQEVGRCYNNLRQYNLALNHLNQALEIYELTTVSSGKDGKIASTLHEIGRCYNYLGKNYYALIHLRRAYVIKMRTASCNKNYTSIAMTLHEIGCCFMNWGRCKVAAAPLNQALELKQNVAIKKSNKSIATTLHVLGRCHLKMQNYSTALNYLFQALEIKQKTSLDSENDRSIATIHRQIGQCHINLHQYEKALNHLIQAFRIKQFISVDPEKDKSISCTLVDIAWCCTEIFKV